MFAGNVSFNCGNMAVQLIHLVHAEKTRWHKENIEFTLKRKLHFMKSQHGQRFLENRIVFSKEVRKKRG